MKKIFVSDFDGTITKKDFFLLYMDRFLGEKGRQFLQNYRAENNPDYQFLNRVFAMRKISQAEYRILLEDIEWDSSYAVFLEGLQKLSFDHLILSAGVAFYIQDALEHQGFSAQKIIANSGTWADGNIQLTHDHSSAIFSPLYGIDKGKAIEELRKEYDIIYFAGDSIPDIAAAENADLVFAKSALWRHYQGEGNPRIIPFHNFAEIHQYLEENYA